MKSALSDRQAGLLLGFVGMVIFSATLPATRIAVGLFNPWFVTFGRAFIAGGVALIVLAILRRPIPRKHLVSIALAGLFVAVGFPGFMGLAMLTVPAVHGGVVLGILPLSTALFAAMFGNERPSPIFWLWVFVGTILVVVFALRDGELGLEIGDFWLLLAALSAAGGYVVLAKLTHIMPGWEAISWALVVSLPISIVGSFVFWDPEYLVASSSEVLAFLYLALFSMYLGFFAWNAGLKLGGISRVSQIQLLQTFITLLIASVLLGEVISLEALMFSVAVLVVVALGQRSRVGFKG